MSWRERHLAAIHELEAAASRVMLGALDEILDSVQAEFAAVVAATDPPAEEPPDGEPPAEPTASLDDLAKIQAQWVAAVDGTVMPWFGEVFEAGGVGAVEQVAEVTGRDVPDVDPALMNEAAARHLATARNRFLTVGEDTWVRTRASLLEGFQAGEGIDPLRRRVQEAAGLSRATAEAVARTEVISAANAGSMTRVRLMGADAPPYKQWLATMDRRTRPTHAAADDQVVPRDDPFEVGIARLDVPGDPAGPADEIVNCRCTVLFIDDPEPLEALGRQQGGITEEVAPLVAGAGHELTAIEHPADGTWSPEIVGDGTGRALSVVAAANIDSTTGEEHTGSMIALVPSDEDVDALQVTDGIPTGEDPDALHLTLWFLGEAADIPTEVQEALRSEVDRLAAQLPAATVEPGAFGVAIWNPAGDTPCVVYNVGGHGLADVRGHFEEAVQLAAGDTGWQMPEQHAPWSAHICATYLDPELFDEQHVVAYETALDRIRSGRAGPITFDRVRLTFGGEVIDVPFTGAPATGAPEPTAAVAVASHAAIRTEEGGAMPWKVQQGGDDCPFEVVNSETGERVEGGCHATQEEADQHVEALYANEPDAAAAPAVEEPAPPAQPGEHFHAVMHTQGVSTGRRTFHDLSWRQPPFAYHWQRSSSAHGGMPEVVQVGLVDRVVAVGDILHGFGHLDLGSEVGREYARQLAEGFTRWVSIGLDEQPAHTEIIWPETEDDEDPMAGLFMEPEQVIITGGRIGELTGVSVPAQDDATVEPTPELLALLAMDRPDAEEEPAMAARTRPRPEHPAADTDGPSVADVVQGLTAAAYRIEIPDLPPAWWFDEPTDVEIAGAFEITEEGRVYGALAPLGVNHRAYAHAGRRQEVPFGNVDYDRFMGGVALTSSGKIAAGPVTMDCGHAPRLRSDNDVAPAHYENACTVVAKVRVGESRERGIVWAAGALEPGITIDEVSRMLACRLSGDWQPHADRNGWQELVAALMVPSPGFPMPRGASVELDDGVLVASSVPVRAVEATGRPRLMVDVGARTVERVTRGCC